MRKAFLANRGTSRNIRFDIQLRRYEVFFVAMKGDPIKTEETCNRHIKHALKYGSQNMKFLRAVGNLMKCVDINPALALTIYDQYFADTVQTSNFAYLFKKIYEKYFVA